MLPDLVEFVGKVYMMLLGYTARVKVVNKEKVLPFWREGKNVIYALWHSRVVFPVAYGRYRLKKSNLSMIVSQSRDGEYIARILETLGFLPVRGSSSGGGARAFSRLLSLGEKGYDLAVTPDGPRGPKEVVKPGIIELAQKSGLTIVPVSYSSSLKKIFKSWDRFMLPFPFSKVVLIFGNPLEVRAEADDIEKKNLGLALSDILRGITRQADEMVAGQASKGGRIKENIIYFFYNFALVIFFIIGSPFFLARVIQGKYRSGLKERLGFLPKRFSDKKNKRIWIHAVSVGEVGAALPIAREIKKLIPEVEIFFSTTTSTGQEVVKRRWGANVFYYPLDFPWAVRRTLRIIKPDLFIAMETEIWPNLFRQAHRAGVTVLLLNARISGRSFQGYRKIKFLLKPVFSKVTFLGTQTEEDGERFRRLGVEREKIMGTGNSKFDGAGLDRSGEKLDYFRALLGLKGREVIVFGSTHPGEEEIILSSCKDLLKSYPHLCFILCPRHPERAGKVEELAKMYSLNPIRRLKLQADKKIEGTFIILDTVGELATIYGLARLVFVGGSFIPKGGQNIIEPAFWGRPIFFGPYMDNFKEVVRIFLEKEAACQIRDGQELTRKLDFFLTNVEKAEEMGRRAQILVQAHQGAARKSAELVLKFIRE